MQDIDFDEIDRAVSSTMGTKPAPASVPVNDAPAPAAPATDEGTPATRRSSGRFMDVFHPSSDMRPAVPERSAPRQSETPVRTAEPAPVTPPAPATNDDAWPDPLDFHGFKDESEPEAPAAEEAPAPLESPFLSDAKVEKRPLGAFSAVESAMSAPATEPTPEPEAPAAPVTEPAPEMPVEAPAPVEEVPSSIPASITQQYKEQPSTTDQPSGAIFDTEAYHQPLAHPTKSKSGLWVVLWIVGLIVVGGGLGAAVYFFVLPVL